MATLGAYQEALRTARAEYEKLTAQRDALAERLNNLRSAMVNLEELTGTQLIASTRPAPRTRSKSRPESQDKGISVRAAAIGVLKDARSALHVREIIERLLKQGVLKPGLEYEKYRLSVVGAIKRRPDVMLVGRGQYIYRGDVGEARTPSKRPKVTTVQLIREGLTGSPGITSAELADRVGPKVQSGAKDRRKVVHSVLHYLLQHERVKKDDHGRFYWRESQEVHNNNGSGTSA